MTWPDLDPAHLICQVDGVSLVLDRRTGRMARLDAIAQVVIEQRDHFSSLDDAALIIAETLQHDSGHVAKGLEALQRELGRLGEGSFTPLPIASGRAEVPTEQPVSSWRFEALGSTIQVCCYNRELAKVVAPYFEVHAPTNTAPLASFHVWSRGGRYWVARDHEKVLARVELADAVTGLIAAITYELFFVPHRGIALHAAAVAHNGSVVAMCGAPGQGKSSTTVELLHRGFGYLSDEVIEIDPLTSVVRGFARPIGLEGPILERFPHLRPHWLRSDRNDRWPVDPTMVASVIREGPLGVLAVLEFSGDHPPEIQRLGRVESVARLCLNTYNLAALDAQDIASVDELVAATPVVLVRHNGAADAADTIEKLVADALSSANQHAVTGR